VAAASEEEREERVSEEREENEHGVVQAVEELELDDGEEEEEEEDEKEEKEEKKDKSEEDKVTEFVEKYVAENRLVRGFKLREYQRSGLLSELVRLGIKTQEVDVIRRMRKHAGEKIDG